MVDQIYNSHLQYSFTYLILNSSSMPLSFQKSVFKNNHFLQFRSDFWDSFSCAKSFHKRLLLKLRFYAARHTSLSLIKGHPTVNESSFPGRLALSLVLCQCGRRANYPLNCGGLWAPEDLSKWVCTVTLLETLVSMAALQALMHIC